MDTTTTIPLNRAKDPARDCIEIFPSLSSFFSALNTRAENPASPHHSQRTGHWVEEFTGTTDYETASKLLMYGDPKTAKTIAKIRHTGAIDAARKLISMPTLATARSGHRPNVPAYVAGRPRQMYRHQDAPANGKTATIFYNAAVSADTDAKRIQEAATRLLAAIRAAEIAGVKVTLFIGVVATHRDSHTGFFVKVKATEQRLNLPLLSYSLINPSFLRRHYFRYVETATRPLPSTFFSNYGNVADNAHDLINAPKDSIFTDFYTIRNLSDKDILALLIGK